MQDMQKLELPNLEHLIHEEFELHIKPAQLTGLAADPNNIKKPWSFILVLIDMLYEIFQWLTNTKAGTMFRILKASGDLESASYRKVE